ncbi:response regulator [Fluviispira sanaruensis]|uniref:Chemotaxis protein CheV n=1 Tax=Fluviispira sanaruensis TaxID=2493639 RepID=A0A4P2VKC0_FLUSA|nr:response regulator [Fluviispira sanaruensis]BBH52344.1 chemotaxis protein CheV [Fluviispira sanaruensis]
MNEKNINEDKNILILPFSIINENQEINFCLNVQKISSVIELDKFTQIPGEIKPFKFIVDMNSIPVPVLEILHLQASSELKNYANEIPKLKKPRKTKKRIIICNILNIYIGIIADQTKKIQMQKNENILPPPQIWEQSKDLFVSGLIKEKDCYRYIFDIEKYIISFGFNPGEVAKDKITDYNFSEKKALIVEDSSVYQLLLKKLMEKYEIEIDLAKNGKDGLDLLLKNQNKYDLIISDIEMPYMNGIDMVREYKRQNKEKSAPVIFHTTISNANLERDLQNEKLGIFLEKFEEKHLMEAIINIFIRK